MSFFNDCLKSWRFSELPQCSTLFHELPSQRHLPLVDLLGDTRAELMDLAVTSGLKVLVVDFLLGEYGMPDDLATRLDTIVVTCIIVLLESNPH